jgi:hypothetical protein
MRPRDPPSSARSSPGNALQPFTLQSVVIIGLVNATNYVEVERKAILGEHE